MPIVAPREGPLTIPPDAITQEQRDRLWAQLIKNWAGKHPEAFVNHKEENQ